MKNTKFGLAENLASVLSYAGVWVSGIFMFIFETENKVVRFHALQSIITFGVLNILQVVLNILSKIPFIGFLTLFLNWIVGIITVVLWIYLMYTSYKGIVYKVPIIGEAVYNQVNKE